MASAQLSNMYVLELGFLCINDTERQIGVCKTTYALFESSTRPDAFDNNSEGS